MAGEVYSKVRQKQIIIFLGVLAMLSQRQREALFIEIHKEIEKSADETARGLAGKAHLLQFFYPPNGGLSKAETTALKSIPKDAVLLAALRKVIGNAIAAPFFHFFCLVDGVGDPEDYAGFWPPFQISPYKKGQPEDNFLHDDFHETYWLWRRRRKDPGWKLDNWTGKN